MKRFIILCLLLSMILIFSGCSSQKSGSINNPAPVGNSPPITVSSTPAQVANVKIATPGSTNATCGRNTCKEGEACCEGWCYNPYMQVCQNGKPGAFSCDGIVYDEHIKSSTFTCSGKLKCPIGETSEYKNGTCTDMNYCNGSWCEPGNICCNGVCKAQYPGCDFGGCWVRNCGPQITHKDIDLGHLPAGLRNSKILN
jgi:hypothetical protein